MLQPQARALQLVLLLYYSPRPTAGTLCLSGLTSTSVIGERAKGRELASSGSSQERFAGGKARKPTEVTMRFRDGQ